MPSEFQLIDRYFAAHSTRRADVVLGIGDDAALLSVPNNQLLVATIDTLVAGAHFLPEADPEGVGHKALAVSLSDLAAMGAEPLWITLALTLPTAQEDWIAAFCQGLFRLADQYGVQLVGGDTTRGPTTVITIQAHGAVPHGQAIRRDGAQPGDAIYVTGTVGDAGLAYTAAILGQATVDQQHHAAIQARLDRPTPRVQEGITLRGIAHAAIDISDGLAQDLGHILQRSGVGAHLLVDQLPLSAGLLASVGHERAITLALNSGDDYELCFTVPQEKVRLLEKVSTAWACGCTHIGTITETPGLRLLRHNGTDFLLERYGYDHFG